MIIIFRIQIIIFIILIIISNLSGQSFYSNNFFLKNLLTTIIIIIIIIIVIIFFLYFSSLQSLSIQPCGSLNPRGVRTNLDGRVCTQCASLLARHLGLQTLLHGSAHPRLAGLGLQTQARSAAPPLALGLQPGAQVCPQRPRLARPRTRYLLPRAVARRTLSSPTPWLGSLSVRYRQPELINYN